MFITWIGILIVNGCSNHFAEQKQNCQYEKTISLSAFLMVIHTGVTTGQKNQGEPSQSSLNSVSVTAAPETESSDEALDRTDLRLPIPE